MQKRKRDPREEALAFYKALSQGSKITEEEFVRGMAPQLGVTEAWFRRRYLKEARERAARKRLS